MFTQIGKPGFRYRLILRNTRDSRAIGVWLHQIKAIRARQFPESVGSDSSATSWARVQSRKDPKGCRSPPCSTSPFSRTAAIQPQLLWPHGADAGHPAPAQRLWRSGKATEAGAPFSLTSTLRQAKMLHSCALYRMI